MKRNVLHTTFGGLRIQAIPIQIHDRQTKSRHSGPQSRRGEAWKGIADTRRLSQVYHLHNILMPAPNRGLFNPNATYQHWWLNLFSGGASVSENLSFSYHILY